MTVILHFLMLSKYIFIPQLTGEKDDAILTVLIFIVVFLAP